MKSKLLLLPLLMALIFCYGFSIQMEYYIPSNSEVVESSHVKRVYTARGEEVDAPCSTTDPTYNVQIHLYGFGTKEQQIPCKKRHTVKFEVTQLAMPEKFMQFAAIPMFINKKQEFDFIQPAHIYKPESEPGHIYMPTSLLSMAARLQHTGIKVNIWDENFEPYTGSSSTVGINLLGAPYIPVVQQLIKRLDAQQILLGGQVINGLKTEEFLSLFPGAHNGNNPLYFELNAIPSEFETSLVPMYEQIPDWQMKSYLEHEFSFFVSQGCKHACKFCAAVRTHKDPATGKVVKIAEQYRNIEVMEKDFTYLMTKAQQLGVPKISIYMSNLDVFQTPQKLHEFATMVICVRARYPAVSVELRGLATVESFLNCVENFPETIELLCEAGYTTTGFGVDGGTAEVWKKVGKAHNFSSSNVNDAQKSIDAIRISWEQFKIKPEMLMVFGHLHVDTEDSLKSAVTLTQDMVQLYNAVPRPHVAKNFIPGNDHWRNPMNTKQTGVFIKHPWLFQGLDFCALASPYTHENTAFMEMVNKYYLEICNIPGNTTEPIYPVIAEMNNDEVVNVCEEAVKEMLALNARKYDR